MNKSKGNAKILSREQTASFLSISFPTLLRWTKEGLLKSYKLGGRVYYKQQEILRALK
jgi:excisionase family DNA binding protein